MSGPVLDLRPDCLQSTNSLDIAIVGVMMLWPDDEHQRRQALEATAINHDIDQGRYPLPRSSEDVRQLRDILVGLPSMTELQSAAVDVMIKGTMTGQILLSELGISDGPRPDGRHLREQIADHFKALIRPGKKGTRMSKKTIDTHVWRTYRCVASFWGAMLFLGSKALHATGCSPFPCSLETFAPFLAIAEGLRRRGERHQLPQSRWPCLLPPAETVRIPDYLKLPHVDFSP